MATSPTGPGSPDASRSAEEELRHEREFVAAIMESAGAIIAVADREGRTVRVNPACEQISGYTAQELIGRVFWEVLIPPEHVPRVQEIYSRLDEINYPLRHESDWITKDGRRLRIEWTNTAMRGPHGRVEYVLAIGIDVTEKRQLEARLSQAQRLETLGRLAGGVAHDFNNMLSAIMGYTDLLLAALRADDPIRADVEEIRRAAARGAVLTRQLVAFSRGQMVQPHVLSLNDVVTDIEKMIQRLIGEDIELTCRLAPDAGLVVADPGQLQQLLMNLAVNARDAMPEGGSLTISTSNVEVSLDEAARRPGLRPGPHVLLSVCDTGVGMDETTLSHLFEPFFTTRAGGSGMGLSMVYGIVKQSGGHIAVESSPGHGARFSIWLPRTDKSPEPARPAPRPSSRVGGTETILLVEDDDAVRRATRRILADAGYVVLEASSGSEAIALASSSGAKLSLVLTDVVMPGMSGRELVARLVPDHAGMRVIYTSAHTQDTAVRHKIPAGEVHFLQKPCPAETLLAKVREVLDEPPLA